MKLNKQLLLSISILTILGISGCARYSARPLNRLVIGVPTQTPKSSVSFTYKVFSRSDCRRYLDRNVISKGYQPIHITFTNNSDRSLYFSLASFSFPCVTPEEVARKVHTSTVGRAVGYGVAGLFIWPFLIPAVVDGVGSHEANKELDADFINKSLHDQVVHPYSTINGLIFVPRASFNEDFTFTLTENGKSGRLVLGSKKAQLKI